MEKYYDIAGTIVKVTGKDEDMHLDGSKLEPFETEDHSWDRVLLVEMVNQLSPPEGERILVQDGLSVYRTEDGWIRYNGYADAEKNTAYIRIKRVGNTSFIEFCSKRAIYGITAKGILNSLESEHFIVKQGGFILHASFIEYHGKAILFTAPSETGKSTQAELWRQLRGAEIINGDRAAVCVTDSGVEARGIPFAGSSGISKPKKLPLAAIVYLSQAPKTTIQKMSGMKSFRLVWEGCSVNTWNPEDVTRCSQTVLNVVQNVPVYYFLCTPDESAVIALENELRKQEC